MISIIPITKIVFEYIYNIDIDIQCYYGLPLGCTGGDTCCTAINPCGVDQGDCDTTDQCKTGLKCGTDNCSIKTGLEWDAEDDCCYTPGAIDMIFSPHLIENYVTLVNTNLK